MHKILSALLFVFTIVSTLAFADERRCDGKVVYTCQDLYLKDIARLHKQVNQLDKNNDNLGILTFFSVATGNPFIFLGFLTTYLGEGVVSIVKDVKSDRETALVSKNIEARGSRWQRRFFRQAKDVKSNVTEDEITEILQKGFDEGTFCKNAKLMTPREMKEWTLKQLKVAAAADPSVSISNTKENSSSGSASNSKDSGSGKKLE